MHSFNISKYKWSVVCVRLWKYACERMCVCASMCTYRLNVDTKITSYVTVHLIFQIASLTKPITHSPFGLDWIMNKHLWLFYFCSFIFQISRHHGHLSSYDYWWTKLSACLVKHLLFPSVSPALQMHFKYKKYPLNFMHYQLMP